MTAAPSRRLSGNTCKLRHVVVGRLLIRQARLPLGGAFGFSNPFSGDVSMSFGNGGGGLLGGGNFYQPNGPAGPWAGCGCSSLFIVIAGVLLVMGGCLRMLNM